MYKILTLNNISVQGLQRLPRESYEVASEISHPDAILVRSFKMHDMEIPSTVAAIGRAGAGRQQHSGRCHDQAGCTGLQCSGCQRQRGQGVGAWLGC